MLPPAELTWDLAEPSLLALASGDLDAGLLPVPTLVAFAGDEPLAVARLRPFEPDESLDPLVELLALLLPIGASRLALSLLGRAWYADDDRDADHDPDADSSVVVVSRADGHGHRPATLATTLHPFLVDRDTWRWGDPITPAGPPDAVLLSAMTTLLDARDEVMDAERHTLALPAQLGRVLLLGHELALAPAAAARLEGIRPPG